MAPASHGSLAVIGLGHIGGSVALAARAAGVAGQVTGFDRDAGVRGRALELAIVDRALPSAPEAVRGASVVVLATPVRSIAAVAAEVSGALEPGALVVDVGSVKAALVRDVEAALPAGTRFVGCHPLAGIERDGPESARADLFQGRPCLICASPRTARDAVEEAASLWTSLGAVSREMDPDQHDAVMAATSHLPHVAAYALAAALAGAPPALAAELRTLVTTSLRDTTRIAASSPVMWRDIFLENRAHLAPLVASLEAALGRLRAAIESGDGAALEAFLASARNWRRAFPGEGTS